MTITLSASSCSTQAQVRVRGTAQNVSDWSKAFSLDAAGSEGIFSCIDTTSGNVYQVSVMCVCGNSLFYIQDCIACMANLMF